MQWLPFVSLLCISYSVVHSIPVNELPLQTDGHVLDARPSLASVTGRDPDAIVYPDEITRDSYGNAVTPFSSSSVDVGLMTDINKDEQLNSRGSVINETKTIAGFVIPGYASGIMKVETLLPPNAPIFPLVVPPPKKQEHESSSIASAKYPFDISNDILPPYKDEPKIKYPAIEVNTQATIFYPDVNFFSQISSHNNKTFTTTSTKSPPTINTNKKNTNSDIYTGGFGGAPGILGEPQPLGIALFPFPKTPTGQHPPETKNPQVTLNVNLLPPLPPSESTVPQKPVGVIKSLSAGRSMIMNIFYFSATGFAGFSFLHSTP